MTQGQSRFVPHEMKRSLIRVYSYRNKEIRGTLQNPYFEEEPYFDNLTQLLIRMEGLLDALDFPQRSMEGRAFDQPEQRAAAGAPRPAPEALGEQKPLATFQLSVLFRQNASWQGSPTWLERAEEARFRSVLELVGLLDSALAAYYETAALDSL